MGRATDIAVQLVHIQGPLTGEIQEFSEPVISIGRHPSCHVHFPKDLTIISRKHAAIIREGNRFKLTDQSTNGTFVNGKGVKNAYLKDGDILTFAKGGPKVSFLTKMMERRPEPVSAPSPSTPKESKRPFDEGHPVVQVKHAPSQEEKISPQKVKVVEPSSEQGHGDSLPPKARAIFEEFLKR